jgi:hypothetical protein
MKEIILKSLKELINDRYLLILISVLILMSILFAINIGLSIHPSELQLVSHYSAFGVTHLYRDQWFYLLVFVAFEPIVALLDAIIAIKIFVIKGRSLAAMFVWLGIGTVFLGWITVSAVLNVWIPL